MARKKNDETETDVPRDEAVAGSRATGGVGQPSQEFVGRVAGDDSGYEGETGAEVRERKDRKNRKDDHGEQ